VPVIKISQQHLTWPFLRQTPEGSGIWAGYKFVFDKDVEECDAWVVIGDLRHNQEQTYCPPHRVLLVNEEPPTMRSYPDAFLAQFATIATCGGHNFDHPGVVETFPLQPWYLGVNLQSLHVPSKESAVRFNYDNLKALKSPKKTKLLSVMCTDKSFTAGHKKRVEFVRLLKAHFGDQIEVFGRGFQFISDKWEAIRDYEYHIAIENSCFPHYWTEKLADAFLGWAYPIYYGCPNIADYFDVNSLTTIDIESPEEAICKIEEVINRRPRRMDAIGEARRRILDEYNMFPMFIRLLNLPPEPERRELVTLRSMAQIVGYTRTFLKKACTKVQFGLGITQIFPWLRRI
jgi:hypothetical protein